MYRIDETLVYFPFEDGVFSYDCVECGGKCCKGFGFQATPSELVQLGKRYPGIDIFGHASGPGNIEFSTLRGGCVFLEEDNLCRVHKEGGKAMKPYVCKIFPLNQFRWSGPVMVVTPNSLCPMKLASGPGPAVSTVTHADTLREMEDNWSGILRTEESRRAASSAAADELRHPWTPELVRFESAALALSSQMATANNLELWAHQASAVDRFPVSDAPGSGVIDPICAELRSQVERVARFLHLDSGSDEELYTDPNLRALTPMIRSELVFRLPWLEHSDVLGMAAPTLVTFSLFAAQTRRLARRPLTLEATRSIVDQFFWPAVFLAYLDMIPWLDFDEHTADDKVDIPKSSDRTDRFVDAINNNVGDRTLAELLGESGANDIPATMHILRSLGRYARWLRFSD